MFLMGVPSGVLNQTGEMNGGRVSMTPDESNGKDHFDSY